MSQTIKYITSLNRGVTPYGRAPHKPILLLAIIEAFQEGYICENLIIPSEEMVFYFRRTWEKFVTTAHSPNFSLPFFHMKNEKGKFWELITLPGKNIPITSSNSIKSFRALTDCVIGAKLSDNLYKEMMNPVLREILQQKIIQTYFPNYKFDTLKCYTDTVRNEILFDPAENYAKKIKKVIQEKKKDEIEEELIIRSVTFRKAIRQIYKNRCAVSGLKVNFKSKTPLIDACHIEPFAETHDDTITNGIAMSPTIHRAFDRGLITISENYKTIVHKDVRDSSENYIFRSLHNKQIILPENPAFYPSKERLYNHRNRFGF